MTQPMTDNKEAAHASARALRGERAARSRRIRRRVISGAVALFVAAWLMITIVLVSGHDPALARKAATKSPATTVASSPASTVTTSSFGATTPGTSSNTSSSSGSSSGNGGVSSVTTSQS